MTEIFRATYQAFGILRSTCDESPAPSGVRNGGAVLCTGGGREKERAKAARYVGPVASETAASLIKLLRSGSKWSTLGTGSRKKCDRGKKLIL